MDEGKTPTNKMAAARLTAIQKIRLQMAHQHQNKVKKSASTSQVEGNPQQNGKAPKKISGSNRRQTVPAQATTKSNCSSSATSTSAASSSLVHTSVRLRHLSEGDTPAASSARITIQERKTKFIAVSEVPACIKGPNPRKSSFALRKRTDNELGYTGRRRHRHPWQANRQSDFDAYFYGQQNDSDSE